MEPPTNDTIPIQSEFSLPDWALQRLKLEATKTKKIENISLKYKKRMISPLQVNRKLKNFAGLPKPRNDAYIRSNNKSETPEEDHEVVCRNLMAKAREISSILEYQPEEKRGITPKRRDMKSKTQVPMSVNDIDSQFFEQIRMARIMADRKVELESGTRRKNRPSSMTDLDGIRDEKEGLEEFREIIKEKNENLARRLVENKEKGAPAKQLDASVEFRHSQRKNLLLRVQSSLEETGLKKLLSMKVPNDGQFQGRNFFKADTVKENIVVPPLHIQPSHHVKSLSCIEGEILTQTTFSQGGFLTDVFDSHRDPLTLRKATPCSVVEQKGKKGLYFPDDGSETPFEGLNTEGELDSTRARDQTERLRLKHNYSQPLMGKPLVMSRESSMGSSQCLSKSGGFIRVNDILRGGISGIFKPKQGSQKKAQNGFFQNTIREVEMERSMQDSKIKECSIEIPNGLLQEVKENIGSQENLERKVSMHIPIGSLESLDEKPVVKKGHKTSKSVSLNTQKGVVLPFKPRINEGFRIKLLNNKKKMQEAAPSCPTLSSLTHLEEQPNRNFSVKAINSRGNIQEACQNRVWDTSIEIESYSKRGKQSGIEKLKGISMGMGRNSSQKNLVIDSLVFEENPTGVNKSNRLEGSEPSTVKIVKITERKSVGYDGEGNSSQRGSGKMLKVNSGDFLKKMIEQKPKGVKIVGQRESLAKV